MKGEKNRTRYYVSLFIRSRQAQNLSPRTVESYQCHLNRLSAFSRLLPESPEEIEDFLSGINCEPETKHSYYRTLRAFYRFLEKRHDLPNPMECVPLPRCRKKVMTTSDTPELIALLRSADDLRSLALLSLFIDCGPRVGGGDIRSLKEIMGHSSIQTTEKYVSLSLNDRCGSRADTGRELSSGPDEIEWIVMVWCCLIKKGGKG